MPRISQLENEPKDNGKNKKTETPVVNTNVATFNLAGTNQLQRGNAKPQQAAIQDVYTTPVNNVQAPQQTSGSAPKNEDKPSGKITDKVENFLNKYFTTQGVESLPDDSGYKNISQKLDSNFANDGTVGSSFITTDSMVKQQGERADKRISTEKLLSGQESKNYTMSPDEINSFGTVVDKRTGQKADDTYVNALYESLGTNSENLRSAYEKLNADYQNGLIDANEYTKQYRELEKQREAFNKDVAEAENFQYVGGMDYYN